MARDFFNKTIYINDNVYMSPFSRGQYKIFINILKIALQTNVVFADMIIYGYDSDIAIYNRIKKNGNSQIQELIELLETATNYSFNDRDDRLKKTNSKITRKLRFLNPLCSRHNNTCVQPTPISEIDEEIGRILSEKRKQYSHQEELFIDTKLPVCTNI